MQPSHGRACPARISPVVTPAALNPTWGGENEAGHAPDDRQTENSASPRCDWCGQPFGGTGRQRFCSPRCRYRARDSERFAAKGTTLAATCAECGARFTYESRGGRRRVVCSTACSRKRAARARRTRPESTENSPIAGHVPGDLVCAFFPRTGSEPDFGSKPDFGALDFFGRKPAQ